MKGQSQASTPIEYFEALEEPRRSDMLRLDALIRETVPSLIPCMLGGMPAYGPFHYKYPSGREGDWYKIGIASNAQYISLYACAADERGYVAERYRERLPRANIGKSCVRFKRLDDLPLEDLKDLLRETEQIGYEP